MSICDDSFLTSPQNINVFVSTQTKSSRKYSGWGSNAWQHLSFQGARWPGGKKSVSWRWSPQDQVADQSAGGQS